MRCSYYSPDQTQLDKQGEGPGGGKPAGPFCKFFITWAYRLGRGVSVSSGKFPPLPEKVQSSWSDNAALLYLQRIFTDIICIYFQHKWLNFPSYQNAPKGGMAIELYVCLCTASHPLWLPLCSAAAAQTKWFWAEVKMQWEGSRSHKFVWTPSCPTADHPHGPFTNIMFMAFLDPSNLLLSMQGSFLCCSIHK